MIWNILSRIDSWFTPKWEMLSLAAAFLMGLIGWKAAFFFLMLLYSLASGSWLKLANHGVSKNDME